MSYYENNIFAKIIAGDLPCHKVYEDDYSFAFLDIMPMTKGHTLVLPKEKSVNILDISIEGLSRVMETIRMLAPSIIDSLNADGFILQQFNGAGAGQTVFHLHFHILPRWEGVEIAHHAANPADNDELAKIANIIKANLN